MLVIEQKTSILKRLLILAGVGALSGGMYLLLLVAAPTIAPVLSRSSITPDTLAAQPAAENRIIIPKIGVDVAYGQGEAALDRGAQWRWPDRGNPRQGGNFIIAAHRFLLAPTPSETIRRSPFYHIDKLAIGDQILIDFDGERFGYEITDIKNVSPDQTEIESSTKTARLTLYSCGLGGSEDLRHAIFAKPLGPVDIQANS